MKTFVTSYGFGLDAVAVSCSTEPWSSDLNRWPRLVNSIANQWPKSLTTQNCAAVIAADQDPYLTM
jgi:hypothetical protein